MGQNKSFIINQLCFFRLRLFGAKFFDSSSLGLYFGGKSGIKRAVTFRAIDIQVSDHNTEF